MAFGRFLVPSGTTKEHPQMMASRQKAAAAERENAGKLGRALSLGSQPPNASWSTGPVSIDQSAGQLAASAFLTNESGGILTTEGGVPLTS